MTSRSRSRRISSGVRTFIEGTVWVSIAVLVTVIAPTLERL